MPARIGIREQPSLPMVVALLEAEGLPASDLTEAHIEHFFLAQCGESLIGLVGLEICAPDALLRSLVVTGDECRKGLGSMLVRHAEGHAAAHQVQSIYLLTTTAGPFFRRLGYKGIDRSRAPPGIRTTREFASLCPASAAFLVKHL